MSCQWGTMHSVINFHSLMSSPHQKKPVQFYFAVSVLNFIHSFILNTFVVIFFYGTVLGNVFHVCTQILVVSASESVKFLIFRYRGEKCIQQEDSDMVKISPLLLIQQRMNNTSISHKNLTEGSFCHRHKMLLNNPHLIIKHRGLACPLHLAEILPTESMNC